MVNGLVRISACLHASLSQQPSCSGVRAIPIKYQHCALRMFNCQQVSDTQLNQRRRAMPHIPGKRNGTHNVMSGLARLKLSPHKRRQLGKPVVRCRAICDYPRHLIDSDPRPLLEVPPDTRQILRI